MTDEKTQKPGLLLMNEGAVLRTVNSNVGVRIYPSFYWRKAPKARVDSNAAHQSATVERFLGLPRPTSSIGRKWVLPLPQIIMIILSSYQQNDFYLFRFLVRKDCAVRQHHCIALTCPDAV